MGSWGGRNTKMKHNFVFANTLLGCFLRSAVGRKTVILGCRSFTGEGGRARVGNIGFCRGPPLSPRNPGEGGGEGGKVALARVGNFFSHPRQSKFPTFAPTFARISWREWEPHTKPYVSHPRPPTFARK